MSYLEPIMAAQNAEREGRMPFVYAEEFYIVYKEQPDGSQKSIEMVTVTKKGMQNPTRTPMRWKDVERTADLFAVLKPYYDNWKKGQETPINGTPLDAWMADPGLVKVLNQVSIRSVEEFVEMPDHHLQKLNIPGIQDKQARAKAFLASRKDSMIATELAELKDKLSARDREIAELKALVEAHVAKKDKEEIMPVKRGPGRPRKNPIGELN